MTTQPRLVTAVARSIRTCLDVDLGGEITYAWAERTNRTGWTVETPAPLGGWVRHEGVILSERELRRAWEQAQV